MWWREQCPTMSSLKPDTSVIITSTLYTCRPTCIDTNVPLYLKDNCTWLQMNNCERVLLVFTLSIFSVILAIYSLAICITRFHRSKQFISKVHIFIKKKKNTFIKLYLGCKWQKWINAATRVFLIQQLMEWKQISHLSFFWLL